MKHTLLHMPLEPYRERYTEYLAAIEAKAFSAKFDYKQVDIADEENPTVLSITSGRVLDQVKRPIWAMRQIEQLLLSPNNDLGRLYFSDFFHPGLEGLAYSGRSFSATAFLWAQTFDKFDFTVPMSEWMRPWEIMAFAIYEQVFVASTLLQDLICAALPAMAPYVKVVGLPFNSKYVGNIIDLTAIPAEDYDVVYTSRWDTEKNPAFFLDLVEARPDLKCLICTGRAELTGNDTHALMRVKNLEAASKITVRTGLTKGQYFGYLRKSKIQFNCALQDWVSFTLLEGLTFGCMPLYPNTRSFPEALLGSNEHLYQQFNLTDALGALDNLLGREPDKDYAREILDYHDGTIERIAEFIA